MRYRILRRGGYSINTISIIGGETSGAVFLSRDPVGAMEAATKRYVDSKMNNLNATAFTEGQLRVEVLPAFTGDITKDAKKNVITLTPTGVAPGTYTKVSVNDKGQVVSGGSLVETDIPSLPFSKVSSGKPSTLAGYGILDALPKEGGILTGKLTASVLGSDPHSVVNKQYIDSLTSSEAKSVMVGGIVYKPTDVQQENFLRCNGGIIDRTTYAKLFNVIGERFNAFLHPGNGKPWSSQYQINGADEEGFGDWVLNSSLPSALGGHRAVVTKNRISVIGGRTNNTVRNTVYNCVIDQFGGLGAWSTGPTIATQMFNGDVVVTKDRVYYVGGYNSATGVPQNRTFNGTIDNTGLLSAISNNTALTLPAGTANGTLLTTRDRILYIGGERSTGPVSVVLSATLNENGEISAWSQLNTIPVPLTGHRAAIINNRCYLFGGRTTSGVVSTIYRSDVIGSDGIPGNYVAVGNLPVAIEDFELVVTKKKVYILGLHDAPGKANCEIIGNIAADGSINSWTFGKELPTSVRGSQVVIVGNKAYMIGGFSSGNTGSTDIYVANFVGGKSDYSREYGDLYRSTLVDRTKFSLPDITPNKQGIFAYIKYN